MGLGLSATSAVEEEHVPDALVLLYWTGAPGEKIFRAIKTTFSVDIY